MLVEYIKGINNSLKEMQENTAKQVEVLKELQENTAKQSLKRKHQSALKNYRKTQPNRRWNWTKLSKT